MAEKSSKNAVNYDFYAILKSTDLINKIMKKSLAPRSAMIYVGASTNLLMQQQKTFSKCNFSVTERPRNEIRYGS